MARASRPPGFDMTYRPDEAFFGPPLMVRIPSFLHAGIGLCVIALVFIVERNPSSGLYDYMFRQRHLIDAHMLAGAFAVSTMATLVRSGMRGVRVRGDFLEYRDLYSGIWPKVRRYRWAQIDLISFEKSGRIILELWDGRAELLPDVRDQDALGRTLHRVALARAIPMDGEPELDDLDDPFEDPDAA